MKTIKDILKSDSIEQRRRIAKNLAISKEDKNALIVNQSNGGGGDSNLIYYKFKNISIDNVGQSIEQFSLMLSNVVNFVHKVDGGSTHIFGPGGLAYIAGNRGTINLLAVGVSKYIKTYQIEGTFDDIINNSLKEYETDANISDYIEVITEEEFYNIKPE